MKLAELDDLLILRGAAHRLTLHSRGPARALLLGSHRSSQRGRGLEFEEVRQYVPGDDPRSIDWRVTARRGRPHTKLYREERERPVWLLVDLNPTLFFGSRLQLKSTLVVRAAALLAWVAARGGDRIGAAIANGHVTRCLAPRSREAGVLPILNALIELQPTQPAPPPPHSLGAALETVAPLVHPGSLILVLSDFATLDARDDAHFSRLAAHNECRLFWIMDPLEREGLPEGRFRGGFPGRIRTIDGRSVRDEWTAAWERRRQRVTALAQRLVLPVTELTTTQPVEQALEALLRAPDAAA
ncbi:MAG TPA: DUF58 domain-containing protein [Povalibacter sp.]|jgi:uncharacterized protein (DUF58 family)|nr:DUF58 domain-containing protein [Povalibacter sp.]